MAALYDTIGKDYHRQRKPDPRIARIIHQALGTADCVLNVGAGTGSYEPRDRRVTALEPSREMIAQRHPDAPKAHQGVAESLPFADRAFDASMALLTVHHWSDLRAGLLEMRRVTRGPLVFLTFDPDGPYFWLTDYFPELVELDQAIMPKLKIFDDILGQTAVQTVSVPHDCTDGFLGAYWRRPDAYLDPAVRSAISSFSKISNISAPLAKLAADIESGRWQKNHRRLLDKPDLDIGYRLIVAESH